MKMVEKQEKDDGFSLPINPAVDEIDEVSVCHYVEESNTSSHPPNK